MIKEMLQNYNDYLAELKNKKYALINVQTMTKDGGTCSYSNERMPERIQRKFN